MLPQIANLSFAEKEHDRRRTRRISIQFGLEAMEHSDGQPLLVMDISEQGLSFHTAAHLGIGEKIDVRLLEGPPVQAEVRWRAGHQYGARFLEPASTAVISGALLRAPHSPPTGKGLGLSKKIAPAVDRSQSSLSSSGQSDSILTAALLLFCAAVIGLFVLAFSELPISSF